MKQLLTLVVTVLTATAAFASFDFPPISNDDFPGSSNWALAMTKSACDIEIKQGDTGVIKKVANGVIYKVYNQNGQLVAKAKAKNTLIWTKKTCITN